MTTGRTMASRGAWLLAVSALVGTGCSTTNPQALFKEAPPTGMPTRMLTLWDSQVHLNPDSMHEGNPVPTLTGDVYLVAETSQFITCNGKVVVDLYDISNNQRIPLERWVFDADTLKKLTVKNMMGWHWQLLMPWGSYRPDITRIALKACLVREKEKLAPLYADESPITLVRPDTPLMRPGQMKPEQMAQNGYPGSNQGVQQVSRMTPVPNPNYSFATPQVMPSLPQQGMPQQGMSQQGMPQQSLQGMQQPSLNPPADPAIQPRLPVRITDLSGQGMQQQPMMNQPMYGSGMQQQPMMNQPMYGSGMQQQPMMNQQQQPMMNQPMYGSAMQQQPMMNQPMYGSAMQQSANMNSLSRQ